MEEMTSHPIIPMSVIENIGIGDLEQSIKDMFFEGKITFNEDVYITNERHKEAFIRANESLQLVNQSIEEGMPEDFFSIDLMSAYEILGKIIGENVEEDLVNMIFKEFCMGK
jgi:tRNA modification GTPase